MNQNSEKLSEMSSTNESKIFAQKCDICSNIETHIELNLNNNNKMNCINSIEELKPNCSQCLNGCRTEEQKKTQDIGTNEDMKEYHSLKRSIGYDLEVYIDIKRIKSKPTLDYFRHTSTHSTHSQLSSHELQTNSFSESRHQNGDKCVDTCDENNDKPIVPIDRRTDQRVCDMSLSDKDWTPKKTPKQVKWRSNLINPHFSEDSLLNTRLSETYYYYGTGIVTGEAGDMFGGNRFQGFSRHLFSDSTGITVELCKPFIINEILFELENKSEKKSPLFAYKVLIAIDECMTDWQLIQAFDQMVCFGRQKIRFYPRIVQYIRIVGSHGVYNENDRECEARYLTLLNFDCIFDQKLIQ